MKRKRNSYIGYYFFSRLTIPFYYLIFGGEVIGRENIPKKGKYILAGKHLGYFDAFLLCSATHRPIHFIAKKELFSNFITKWFFNVMHLIPVDRSNRNPEAKKEVENILNNGKLVCIFPEGTFNKNGNELLPFKKGTVRYAKEFDTKIIPFTIIGKYKLWNRPKLIIGKPIDVKDMDINYANQYLYDSINDLTDVGSEPLFFDIENYVKKKGYASIKLLQDKYKIGYNRCIKLIRVLQNRKVIEKGNTVTNVFKTLK